MVKFLQGDLVFAKIKGYPAWPARVTSLTTGGRYSVFFYGTFQEGTTKENEMWPYNQKYVNIFGEVKKNKLKKVYQDALYQIEHTPEIAAVELGEDRIEFSDGDLVFARVRGYPVWPARVIGKTRSGQYRVFFYGTFELGSTKPEDMWPYDQKYLERMGYLENQSFEKTYNDALYQIENCPDIALQHDEEIKDFSVGDFVFARVKDYPAWPAQVINKNTAGKYSAWVEPTYKVFLYGLCEVGRVKSGDMWPYNKDFLDKFEPVGRHKKWYSEGLHQMQHNPEIATQKLDEESDDMVTDDPLKTKVSEQNTVKSHILMKDMICDRSSHDINDIRELGSRTYQKPGLVYDQENHFYDATVQEGKLFTSMMESSVESELSINSQQGAYDGLREFEYSSSVKLKCNLKTAEDILQHEESLIESEVNKVQYANEKVDRTRVTALKSLLERKVDKLEGLRAEERLLTIICQIRRSIMSKSKENMIMCVEMLKEMEKCTVEAQMIVKMPEVLTTLKRLVLEFNMKDAGGDNEQLRKDILDRSRHIRDKIEPMFTEEHSCSTEEFGTLISA